ncbi:nitrous oxide reductase accessory protein NosL [Rhodoflexus sp.]
MKSSKYFLFTIIFLLISACSSQKSDDNSAENTRCVQCGMPTEEFQAWRGKITGQSATKYYCSPRCLFINSQAQGLAATDSVFVTDYYDQEYIDGRKAFYVIGSDVIGPMGHDLIPLATRQAADDFIVEHKGKQILTFDEVNAETIKQLGKQHMK